MSLTRRLAIILVSIGWIAPLSLAWWSEHLFLWEVLLPMARDGKAWIGSFPPEQLIERLFVFATLWMAAVIAGWGWWLTGREPRR